MRFVPSELRDQESPCRLIPLTPKGETIDYFYRCGTQIDSKRQSPVGCARKSGASRNAPRTGKTRTCSIKFAGGSGWCLRKTCTSSPISTARTRTTRWRTHCTAGLTAAEKVPAPGDSGRALVARIRPDRQDVFEVLHGKSESVQLAPSLEVDGGGCGSS